MRVPWLADVLRNAGLTVVETNGWRGRGKELDAVEGVVMHHTASPRQSSLQTNLYVVTNGNGVGPGPIAQCLIWRDGSCYLIADGKANHAGAGGPWGWLPLSPPGQLSVANGRTVGFECVNDGVGEPWPAAQVIAMEIAAAAVLRHIGQDESRCLMHSEWAPTRKIDPAGPNSRIALNPGSLTWAGYSFRDRVASWLNPPPTIPPTPTPSEDDVRYLHVTCPGRPEVLFAFDGAGCKVIGFSSVADRDAIVAAYGAPTAAVSDAQYAELIARTVG